jgi:predicted HAD superfamily Cof-like phosphohydrolase
MSTNWVQDIADMHQKYGVNPVVRNFDKDKLAAFLKFRIDFLQEELDEMRNAVANRQASVLDTTNASDDVVDALIDLCVVAIGTLDAFDVNAYEAWDRVHKANMNKEVGVKASRPNPLGLPDLVKPEGWVAPTHKDNLGLVAKALS